MSRQKIFGRRDFIKGLAGLVVGSPLFSLHGCDLSSKDSNSSSENQSPKVSNVEYGEYIVQSGDTLSEIAEDHGVLLEDLLKANPSYEPDLIHPGDKLRMPSRRVRKKASLYDSSKLDVNFSGTIEYDSKTLLAIAMYSEAATEPELAKKVVGRVALNRVARSDYADDLWNVLGDGLSSVGSKNWRQATGELNMNSYEKIVWNKCLNYAQDLLNGEKLGVSNEYRLVAFDDIRSFNDVKSRGDKYWDHMQKVGQAGKMVYCIDVRDSE